MSIVESLKRLVDPERVRKEELERKALREQPVREEAAGDEGGGAEATIQYRCRVCGHESAEAGYCPDCLADTMRRIKKN